MSLNIKALKALAKSLRKKAGVIQLNKDNLSQTCEEYLNNWDAGDLWDEMYWSKDFSAERALESMIHAAGAEGISLTDVNTWNYEDRLWQVYKETEKGLS